MINFGDSGLIVQYIQNFLKDNYDKDISLSDVYDKNTHKALIKYLQLPEMLDSYSMKDLLLQTFTFRESTPPNKLIDGGGIWNFDFDITPDEIRFYNRDITQCFNGALAFINQYIDDVNELCKNNGWYVSTYYNASNTNYDNIKKIEFIVRKENRKQLLPCKEIIKMINLFTNDFLLEKCFIDEKNSYHSFIQNSKHYKICYIPAKPGDSFSIAHGYKYDCELAIAYIENEISEIKNEDFSIVKEVSSFLDGSIHGKLKSNEYVVYNIPKESKCKYLLIQMPYNTQLISPKSKQINIKLGDINQDGKINYTDFELLKNHVNGTNKLSGIELLAANVNKDIDVNGNQIVNELDLQLFKEKLNEYNISGKSIDFGETIYEKEIIIEEKDNDKLLIMYGNVSLNNKNNELNIPFYEFQINPWIIHDNFLHYILDSSIHKYSNINDIEWVQNQIVKLYPEYKMIRPGLYDSSDSYLTDDYLSWDETTSCYKYYQSGIYSGYILNSNNLVNSTFIRDSGDTTKNVKILNSKIYANNEWTGKRVLSNGRIVLDNIAYSLKELVKSFQIDSNKLYANHSSEQIKFITGYVDPLTEKRLKQATYNL